jgi:site-specific DNA-methyltransferase (adenine-specific)
MKITDKITLTNEDNMALMARYPDNYFDLAIVDPPYGIKHSEIAGKQSGTKYGKAAAAKREYTVKEWDKQIPPFEYFNELMRLSKNQIIWGANYMTKHLPPSMGWIFWDKDNGTNGFSDGELAYTSFDKGLRKVKITWNGMIQHDMKNKEIRIHPTQKPVKLYEWLLMNYAKEGDKILDTHLGSGSIALAAHNLKFELVGCELDTEYYHAAVKRLKDHVSQLTIFDLGA